MTSKRNKSWEFLKAIKAEVSIPWLCYGDFNEITCQGEKIGGCPRPYRQMEIFRDVLESCSLKAIQTRGSRYTWTNNRRGRSFTKEKLDRALVNLAWKHLFKEGCYSVEPAVKSNHSPLVIFIGNKRNYGSPQTKCFRMEAAWLLNEDCVQTIKEAWGKAASGEDLSTTLKRILLNCRSALNIWNSKTNKKIPADIKKKLVKVKDLQENVRGEHIDSASKLQKEIDQSLVEEDLKWKQRAK
ncbi:uncharacterized protein LOC122316197 [Carya illinoinensis]|uniref:uncharacterized protein LOC122316197 n=1 Tax=Carya illinoinensis TaxID=32201 RepID=UPI001C724063|nr:uncharacterized protein LOC122316197 [Carya illinoinensis]